MDATKRIISLASRSINIYEPWNLPVTFFLLASSGFNGLLVLFHRMQPQVSFSRADCFPKCHCTDNVLPKKTSPNCIYVVEKRVKRWWIWSKFYCVGIIHGQQKYLHLFGQWKELTAAVDLPVHADTPVLRKNIVTASLGVLSSHTHPSVPQFLIISQVDRECRISGTPLNTRSPHLTET